MPEQSPRILIVRLSAVGDVVHALPALDALRRGFPDAFIGWVCHPGPSDLLRGHPQIDKLIVLPRRFGKGRFMADLKAFKAELRDVPGGWDVAIDFQGLAKSGLVTWLSKARRRIGYARSVGREGNYLLMSERVTPRARAVVAMNLELLGPLGLSPSEATLVLHQTPEDTSYVETW